MKKITAFILALAFLSSGCASTMNLRNCNPDYRIRVGDELRIVIWEELDEKAIVRPDKKVSLPIVGEVSCRAKTPDELSQELTHKFDMPTTVMVTKYHTLKDDFKEIIGVIRDAAIVYFIGERIANGD